MIEILDKTGEDYFDIFDSDIVITGDLTAQEIFKTAGNWYVGFEGKRKKFTNLHKNQQKSIMNFLRENYSIDA